jgi:hypothetical protein
MGAGIIHLADPLYMNRFTTVIIRMNTTSMGNPTRLMERSRRRLRPK